MAFDFGKIKEKFSSNNLSEDFGDEFVEITPRERKINSKIVIRPFVVEDFADIKPVLDALREGTTVALVNIKPLKERDLVELKRAVNKLKKTCDAIEGDIAGFGEDWIVVTPSFGSIYRAGGQIKLD